MGRRTILALTAIVTLCLEAAFPGSAAAQPTMLFYDAATGNIASGRLGIDGNFTDLATGGGLSKGWTHVVATGRELLFYNAATGNIASGRLGTDGNFTGLTGAGLSKGWTHVVATAE